MCVGMSVACTHREVQNACSQQHYRVIIMMFCILFCPATVVHRIVDKENLKGSAKVHYYISSCIADRRYLFITPQYNF